MLEQFQKHVPSPLGRYLIIEGAIVAVLTLTALVFGFPVEYGLIIVGVIVLTIPFMGSNAMPSDYGIWREGLLQNEFDQMTERARARSRLAFFNGYVRVGLPLVVVGFILALL